MPRIRLDNKEKKNSAITDQRAKEFKKNVNPIHKGGAARPNPFYFIKSDEFVFDLIIPLCNQNHPDFEDRLKVLQLILDNTPAYIHIILIEQQLDDTSEKYTTLLANSPNLTLLTVKNGTFNKAWLYNIGVRYAKTNQLLMSEAQFVFEKHYWSYLLDWIKDTKYQWAISWSRILSWEEDGITLRSILHPRPGEYESPILFHKAFFWSIGGYNEWMKGSGKTDNEIIRRAEYASSRSEYFSWTLDQLWPSPYSLETLTRNQQIYLISQNNPVFMLKFLKKVSPQAGNMTSPLSDRIEMPRY